MAAVERILVIKLGALGDFVLATGPFKAIRQAHPGARIVLLTTAPYAEMARTAPFFDEVWVDSRPRLWQPGRVLALRRRLRRGNFARVYDLQTSDRSGWYFRLMGPGPRPDWSGIARGASHRHTGPDRVRLHTVERQRAQLALAGIADVPGPDLSWLDGDLSTFELDKDRPLVLLVPGGAAHRPQKRWPAGRYGALAARLLGRGYAVAVIGGPAENALGREIAAAAPGLHDLTGETTLGAIAALARRAVLACGNDTGPMHLITASGCPAVILYSHESDPALCAPRGAETRICRVADLGHLPLDKVVSALDGLAPSLDSTPPAS